MRRSGNKGTGVPGEEYTKLPWNAPEQQYQQMARNYLEGEWQKKIQGKPTWANAGQMYDPTQTAPMMKLFNYILSRPKLESGVRQAYQRQNKAQSLADRLKTEGLSLNEISPEDLAMLEYYGGK